MPSVTGSTRSSNSCIDVEDITEEALTALAGQHVLPSEATATIYDQLVSFIRTSLRAAGIVFLAIALAAFWFAPTGAGAAVRTGAGNGLARLRNRTGMDTGPVGPR